MNQEYINAYESDSDQNEFDLKKWMVRMLKMWPWFAISLSLFLTAAFFYLRYAHPVYSAGAEVMVKDEKKGAEMMDNSVMKEMGLGGNSKLLENEIEVLKSPDLMEAVVNRLNLYISIKHTGRIRDIDVFKDEIPFTIEIAKPNLINQDRHWTIDYTKNGIFFQSESDRRPISLEYGRLYNSGGVLFSVTPDLVHLTDKYRDSAITKYKVNITKPSIIAAICTKKLNVEAVNKLATVISLGINDNNEKRAIAILQSLISIYNQQGLEDKNRVTDSTINFLNDRLVTVVSQLQGVESTVEKFKTTNKITDIPIDEQQYMELAQQVDVQKAQNETQLNIINALEKILDQNQDNPQLVPSTLGIAEPTLGVLIEQHNQLVLQKERIQQKSGPLNPLLIDLQDQIKAIRMKLLANVRNLKQAYHIAMSDVSKKDDRLNTLIRKVPSLEKNFIQITRNKDVQSQIYAFLLQKREESEVTRASNVEDSRVIAKPRSLGIISPKTNMIWSISILMGILLPVILIVLKDFMNNKIGDIAQVEQRTDVPLLGVISHVNKLKAPVVISSHSRSAVAEQIRSIRTAISFTGKAKDVKTILISSFQPGDGKSFISLNLAAGYALLNKKTVILEFDLRRPQITKNLGLDVKEGISSILSGQSELNDLLVEVPGLGGNLFLLPAGYLPPNPAELISSPRMRYLIDMLEQQFDHIIIDTPPFTLVTDATLLQKYTDITLIVLRQDHTSREVYTELKQRIIKQPEQSLYLLLNDVGKRKRYQDRYGIYGYGYSDGDNYYHDEK